MLQADLRSASPQGLGKIFCSRSLFERIFNDILNFYETSISVKNNEFSKTTHLIPLVVVVLSGTFLLTF